MRVHGSASNISTFKYEDIQEQLRAHIGGWKHIRKQAFASHFISCTDSFEASINRAERHLSRGQKDVYIYVIDTYTLCQPTLVLLIFAAIKAWNVDPTMIEWRAEMYRHGSLTEWIIWDELKVRIVAKLNWRDLSRPAGSCGAKRGYGFWEALPEVMKAAQVSEDQPKGLPRTQTHAAIYASAQIEAERAAFAEAAFAGRCGELPKAPASVKNDVRAGIDVRTINNIWRIVHKAEHRNLLFLWILSLMTERYYFESIVEAVIRHYPGVVTGSLHTLSNANQDDPDTTLVYYMPDPECSRRIDVHSFNRMVRACIVQWDLEEKDKRCIGETRTPVYIVSGAGGPARSLISLEQLGELGRCGIRSPPIASTGRIPHPTLNFVKIYGWRVQHLETDAECAARRQEQYNNMFYVPELSGPVVTTKKIYHKYTRPGKFVTPDLTKHGSVKNMSQLGTASHCEGRVSESAEQRLMLAQARKPPAPGTCDQACVIETTKQASQSRR